MHELGIVVHISKTLEELAQENNITDIRRVTLQIGKVSGIVPVYLVDCWQYGRECPYCKSEHTVLLQGNECLIKEIEAE